MNTKEYIITYEYLTEDGRRESESELVHSYREGFQALNSWLYKNHAYGYSLISARIKED